MRIKRFLRYSFFIFLATCISLPFLSHATSRREPRIYYFNHFSGENAAVVLMAKIKGSVHGRELYTDSGIIDLEEPIKGLRINKLTAAVEAKATQADFQLLVDYVLSPLDTERPDIFIEVLRLDADAPLSESGLTRRQILDRRMLMSRGSEALDVRIERMPENYSPEKSVPLTFTILPSIDKNGLIEMQFKDFRLGAKRHRKSITLSTPKGEPVFVKTELKQNLMVTAYEIRKKADYRDVMWKLKSRGY